MKRVKGIPVRQATARRAVRVIVESVETRCLFSSAFDVAGLTALRADPAFVDVDGSDVGVAILDTGVYAANPDLQQNVVGWYNAVSDPVDTPLDPDAVSAAFDNVGHGSHVAGTAASSNPDIGVAYAAKIVAVKVLADPGEQQLGGDPVARGLRWVQLHAADLNIKVVNLSLGTAANVDSATGLARTEIGRAIGDLERLGVTVVAATGNSYAQYVATGAAFPAAVSTISVANAWSDAGRPEDFNAAFGGDGDRYFASESSAAPDRLAATSQRSTLANQLLAPGQDVYSTWNGASADGGDGLHKVISGTSMAAPFVSGLVALMQDAARTFGGQYLSDPNEILRILQETATTVTDYDVPDNARVDTLTGDLSALPETGLTFSRVNAEAAVRKVFDLVTAGNPSPTPAPGTETDTDSVRSRATAVPALNATRGFTYTGNVGTDGTVAVGNNDVDLYQLTVTARGDLTVALSSPDGSPAAAFDATVRLFNAAGVEVARAVGDASAGGYPILRTDPGSPLQTGVYYLGVSGWSNDAYDVVGGTGAVDGQGQGDYAMALSLSNPDPDGAAAGATDVDLTNPNDVLTDPFGSGRATTVSRLQGVLGADDAAFADGSRVKVSADVDMYRVVAPDDGRLAVVTQARALYGKGGADTYVQVYDENLNLIASNDDAKPGSGDSAVRAAVTAGGTYYVAVTVLANKSFDARDPYSSRTPDSTPTEKRYDLLLWADNGDVNGTALTATPVAAGLVTSADVGTDNGKLVGTGAAPTKDVDWYVVTSPKDGLLRLNVTSTTTGFAPSMSLWALDESGSQIVRIDGETGDAPTLYLNTSAGRKVFVAVTGSGNESFDWFAVASGTGGQAGGYTFAADVQSADVAKSLTNDSVKLGTPTPIAVGQSVNGNVGRDGQVIVGPADVDLYAFTPTADAVYRVRTLASSEDDADTVVRVFDDRGRELAVNDNATDDGKASRLTVSLKAGRTYYIGVNGASIGATSYNPITGDGAEDGTTGRYGLTLEQLPAGSVSVRFDADHPARYTDPDGRPVLLRMYGPGSGRLEYDATGDDHYSADHFSVVLDNTETDTIFRVSGLTTMGNVDVNGPLFRFRGGGVTLAGALNVEGSVNAVYVDAAAPGSNLLSNLIGEVHVRGDWAGSVTVSGDVGSFEAGGNLTGGTWDVAGGVQSLRARDVTAAWTGNFGGEVGTFRVRSLAGPLTALSIHNLTVSAEISNTTVRTTFGGIELLSANRLMDAEVRSYGDVDRVVVTGGAYHSAVYAGVSDAFSGLPTGPDAFVAASAIRSFSVRSVFGDSKLVASEIGSVTLADVARDNGGKPFGIATTGLASLSVARVRSAPRPGQPIDTSPIGDFQVNLLPPLPPDFQPTDPTPVDGSGGGDPIPN